MSQPDDEKPARPFRVLRGRNGGGPRTGVVYPDGLGKVRKLGARCAEDLAKDSEILPSKLRRQPIVGEIEHRAYRDPVREANQQMLPDHERYPQKSDDDETEEPEDQPE